MVHADVLLFVIDRYRCGLHDEPVLGAWEVQGEILVPVRTIPSTWVAGGWRSGLGRRLLRDEILQCQLRAVPEEGTEEQEDDSEDGHRDLPGHTLVTT